MLVDAGVYRIDGHAVSLSDLSKKLLDHVNVEDRGCTEKVIRGASAGVARAGHLSHLERPNYDFAQYLAERTGGFKRNVPTKVAAE